MPEKEERVKKSLYFSVFKVVRQPSLPTMEAFMEKRIDEILGPLREGSPDPWTSFWEEILVDTIQKDLCQEMELRILNLSPSFLANKDWKIKDLVKYAMKPAHLVPCG